MDKNISTHHNGRMRGVTHHVPHRTRYKLASHHRNDEIVNQLHKSLNKVTGVNKIEYNDRTGSLLVHHDEIPGIVNTLGSVFDEIAFDLFEEIANEEIAIAPGTSLFAYLIGKRFAGVNNYLAHKTSNYFDLKMLLPLLFLGAGFYQISKEKGTFGQVPAWVLFYYAYDAYIKFHGTNNNSLSIQVPGNGHRG